MTNDHTNSRLEATLYENITDNNERPHYYHLHCMQMQQAKLRDIRDEKK